jgi:hypothetical protein
MYGGSDDADADADDDNGCWVVRPVVVSCSLLPSLGHTWILKKVGEAVDLDPPAWMGVECIQQSVPKCS